MLNQAHCGQNIRLYVPDHRVLNALDGILLHMADDNRPRVTSVGPRPPRHLNDHSLFWLLCNIVGRRRSRCLSALGLEDVLIDVVEELVGVEALFCFLDFDLLHNRQLHHFHWHDRSTNFYFCCHTANSSSRPVQIPLPR